MDSWDLISQADRAFAAYRELCRQAEELLLENHALIAESRALRGGKAAGPRPDVAGERGPAWGCRIAPS